MGKYKSESSEASSVTYPARSLGMTNAKPEMESEYMELDQCMMNDGMSAQELGRKLGASLDSDFPVK